MFSRRDFLKKTGLTLGSVLLGNSLNSKLVKGESYKDITDQIPEVSQEEFMKADWRSIIAFTGDQPNELFSADSRNDRTLVKFYPIHDENIPHSVIFDQYNRGFGFQVSPYLDISSVSTRQIKDESVKFKMNLLESPLNLPEKFKEEIMNSENSLMYSWRIDTDRDKKTGENKVRREFERAWDYEKHFYIGSEYNAKLRGNGEEWEAFLENTSNGEKSPLENFNIKGNEVELTLNLEDMENPESFNFGGWNKSPSVSSEIGRGDWFEDMCPTEIHGETNYFGAQTPSPDNFRPGTFEVDPTNYEGDGTEELTKVYKIPQETEKVKWKYKEGTEEIEVPITVIIDTGDSEFLLDYHEGDIRARKEG